MNFSDNVLQLLKDKGLNQSDLAKLMNKPRQNISTILRKNSPSMQTIREFADALEVSEDKLLKPKVDFKPIVVNDLSELINRQHFAITNDPDLSVLDQTQYLYSRLLSITDNTPGLVAPIDSVSLSSDQIQKRRIFSKKIIEYINLKEFNVEDVIKNYELDIQSANSILKGLSIPNFNTTLQIISFDKNLNIEWLFGDSEYSSLQAERIVNKAFKERQSQKRADENFRLESRSIFRDPNSDNLYVNEKSTVVPDKGKLAENSNPSFKIINQEYGNEFVILRDNKFLITTPLITVRTQYDYIENLGDAAFINELELHAIIIDKLQAGVYRSFEVVGNHMENPGDDSISDGSIVTGYLYDRKLSARTFEFAYVPTRQFVVVTKDVIKITEIKEYDKTTDDVVCKDTNPDLPKPYRFNGGDIQELYVIVAVTQYRGDWMPGRVYRKHYEPDEE